MAARKTARKKVQRNANGRKTNRLAGTTKPENVGKYTSFLSALRRCGNFRASCGVAGIDERSVRDRMQREPLFAHKVYNAKSKLVDKLADKQIVAATKPDHQGRYDTRAGQFMLTNLDPENYKHRRDDTIFDGSAYESGIQKARQSMTPEEREELQEMGKRRILQRGSASPD